MIDPHKITFEIMELLLFFIYKILLIYLDFHVPIFFCFLFYFTWTFMCPTFFVAPCLSSQKGKNMVFILYHILEVSLLHKVTKLSKI